MGITILPRLIRQRDAPAYLGMDTNRFNEEVRPHLIEIPIGKQGVAFDRLDLDAWVDQYKNRNGRPGKARKGGQQWEEKCHRDSSSEECSITCGRRSEEKEFVKALDRAISGKQKDTWPT